MPDHEWSKPLDPPEPVQEIARTVGGTIQECAALPDGSGFATMSFPLPKDHWIYADEGTYEAPPMPFQVGVGGRLMLTLTREEFAEALRAAGRYAVRAATMKGKEMDFDPDALVQNLIVGALGYCTPTGLSEDAWANPPGAR